MAWCAHCRYSHTPDECRAMFGCTRQECSPLPVLCRQPRPVCVCTDVGAPCRCPCQEGDVMGWAHGTIDGREVGHGVEAVCDRDGCEAEIDRGLAYRCGGPDFDAGCGGYFCADDLFYTRRSGQPTPQMCERCCW